MKGQEFKTIAVFVVLLGLIAIIAVYQNLQTESSQRIKYEYETLKSYLKLPEDVLDKLLHGSRVTGNLKYVEGFNFENKTLFKVRNAGEIPLTGFRVTFNSFVVLPEIAPYLLPPKADGIIIVESQAIAKKGTLLIETDQGVSVLIEKAT